MNLLFFFKNVFWLLFFFKIIIPFVYFWLCWVCVAVQASLWLWKWGVLSGCRAWTSHRGGFCPCTVGLQGSRASAVAAQGLRSCGLLGSRARSKQLRCMSLVILRHVRASWSRGRTHVSCIWDSTPGFFTAEPPGKSPNEPFKRKKSKPSSTKYTLYGCV